MVINRLLNGKILQEGGRGVMLSRLAAWAVDGGFRGAGEIFWADSFGGKWWQGTILAISANLVKNEILSQCGQIVARSRFFFLLFLLTANFFYGDSC